MIRGTLGGSSGKPWQSLGVLRSMKLILALQVPLQLAVPVSLTFGNERLSTCVMTWGTLYTRGATPHHTPNYLVGRNAMASYTCVTHSMWVVVWGTLSWHTVVSPANPALLIYIYKH